MLDRQNENTISVWSEIMLALTEELGEIATEVALLEQIGCKAEWRKPPREASLAEEIIHAINLLSALANQFDVDMTHEYKTYQQKILT